MQTAIIVDDERLARHELKRLLEKHPSIQVIGEAANSAEGIKMIESKKPDLVFLDIELPGQNGFEMLEELEHIPRVIFTTAYEEYALQAFDINAYDYLLKPVEPVRLEEAILKTEKQEIEAEKEKLNPADKLVENDRIFIKEGERCWFVKLPDIWLFESAGNYSRVYFGNFKPLIVSSLTALEKKLDPKLFFRANRKQIINIQMIEKIEINTAGKLTTTLATGETIQMSRRQSIIFREMKSI